MIPSLFHGLRASRRIWLVLLEGICIAGLSYAQNGISHGSSGVRSAPNRPATPPHMQSGQELFSARCGVCHGRDAGGGEGGPDLIASVLVAQDVHGERIGPVIRNGRPDKGMPAIELTDEQKRHIAELAEQTCRPWRELLDEQLALNDATAPYWSYKDRYIEVPEKWRAYFRDWIARRKSYNPNFDDSRESIYPDRA